MAQGIKTRIIFDRSQAGILEPKVSRKAISRSMKKAGTSGQRATKSSVKKRVRAALRLKAKLVNRAIHKDRARTSVTDKMWWQVSVDDKPVPLARFAHRQTRRGVSAAVNKGKRMRIDGAFVSVGRSGRKAVFIRKSSKRLPIKELYGTKPLDVMNRTGEALAAGKQGRGVAIATYERVWPLEVAKANTVSK